MVHSAKGKEWERTRIECMHCKIVNERNDAQKHVITNFFYTVLNIDCLTSRTPFRVPHDHFFILRTHDFMLLVAISAS